MIKQNRIRKIFNQLSLVFICLFLIFGCESEDSNDPDSSNNDASSDIDSKQDSLGNLVVVNQLLEQIYLYHSDGILLKRIPSVTRFRVYVPVNETSIEQLKIWKKSNISDPLLPDSSTVYRSWDVELLNSNSDQDLVSWIIGDSEPVNNVGELILNYPSTDATGSSVIYNVDLFLQDTSSMFATTLNPGLQGRKIGLDYGFYDLHYLFWFQSENRVNVAWSDNNVGNEQNSIIINANNPNRIIEINPFYGSNIGRKGKIKIVNNSGDYLRIVFNDSVLIESVEMESLPSTGLSLLDPNGGNFTFTIPENYYTFSAKNIDTDLSQDLREQVYIMELYEYIWDINEGSSYSEISITNNSGQDLTIHNGDTGNYLGIYIPNDMTSLHMLPDSIQKLIAKNLTQDQDATLDQITSIWRITDINSSFHITFDPSTIQDGEVAMSNEIEFSWSIGTDNQDVSFQLLNTNFEPHNVVTVIDSPITSYSYRYLDDTDENQFYTFRLNSYSTSGQEFGWQEISFQVDAVQANGIRMYPMQSQLNSESSSGIFENYTFDILLEDVDSLASFYIEIEFDNTVFSIDPDSVFNGALFDSCTNAIVIMNDDVNETGKLGINVSLIGDDCQLIAGSGTVFSITLISVDQIEIEETYIYINSNSTLRDKQNSVIPISNIFLNYPLTSRIVFN